MSLFGIDIGGEQLAYVIGIVMLFGFIGYVTWKHDRLVEKAAKLDQAIAQVMTEQRVTKGVKNIEEKSKRVRTADDADSVLGVRKRGKRK